MGTAYGQGARIVEWVENAPSDDSTRIALGYPVPIPVDTPVPFDGFRSYAGLHTRHQDLMNSSDFVHGQVIGQTRSGRDIWAYRLGDEDLLTRDGDSELATLTNGGIHAREWQTPEVVTGIMELFHEQQDDNYLFSYLRDNVNVIVIPVLNVDGFMQTQRFPKESWLGTDINAPASSPRDGRMRRKNMLGADEDINTQGDHLQGVDLNRNNSPYWSTNPSRSDSDSRSLIHHGQAARSEPEILALDAAAQLGPINRLALYTDVHSFSQVHFWVRNDNDRLASLTSKVLNTFSGHHFGFPEKKFYSFNSQFEVARNAGIGSTDEYFTHTYQVPSWTLEVEPGNNGAADYGGLARNGHDGFILPESQISRVRSQLAESFAVTYYRQAGPPAIAAIRLTDTQTGAVVYDAEWDNNEAGSRVLNEFIVQPLRLGREYQGWIAFNKPMRWEVNGEIAGLPGTPSGADEVDARLLVNGSPLTVNVSNQRWADMPGESPSGYKRYRYDALAFDFNLPADSTNQSAVSSEVNATIEISAFDFTGQRTDANPSTVAHWENGGWSGYEDGNGSDLTDSGGLDKSMSVPVSQSQTDDPFVVEAGTSSIWIDLERDGEGFMLEVLADNVALVYWFTYDETGAQDWYLAVGEVRGNRILFDELLQVTEGYFGPGFDPSLVKTAVVGSAKFSWDSCDSGTMDFVLERDGQYREERWNINRITRLMGIDCGNVMLPPVQPEGLLSGTWADLSRAAEGFSLEVLSNGQVLVYWFSFGPGGERRWFFNVGEIQGTKLVFDDLLTTWGPIFGEKNPPGTLQFKHWGEVELELGCLTGTATYSSVEPGFAPGTQNLSRITLLDGLSCP
jgi:hypothetical protein